MKIVALALLAVTAVAVLGFVVLRAEPTPAGAASGSAAAGAPSDAPLKDRLTRVQYYVTQQDGTEPPYANPYWDHKAPGLYVDVVDGTPLFASTTKYESGTGWPSFWAPVSDGAVTTQADESLFMTRTEVRSASSDSHLGHVFEDGPEPTGLRYCMNSAALRFVPVAELEAEGYGEYLPLFDSQS